MLDIYFKKPVLWDYIVALIISIIIFTLNQAQIYELPKKEYSIEVASDLSNIAFTSAGFILTLLTILITFKSSTPIQKKDPENETIFNLFFTSSLYFETVLYLKNCIKSLIVVSILGFSLKLGLSETYRKCIFYFDIIGLVVIILTLWRCLLILTKILELQKKN